MCSALRSVNDRLNVFETVQQLKKVKIKNELASYKNNTRTTASQIRKWRDSSFAGVFTCSPIFLSFFSLSLVVFLSLLFPATLVSRKKRNFIFVVFLPVITKEKKKTTWCIYEMTSNTYLHHIKRFLFDDDDDDRIRLDSHMRKLTLNLLTHKHVIGRIFVTINY